MPLPETVGLSSSPLCLTCPTCILNSRAIGIQTPHAHGQETSQPSVGISSHEPNLNSRLFFARIVGAATGNIFSLHAILVCKLSFLGNF